SVREAIKILTNDEPTRQRQATTTTPVKKIANGDDERKLLEAARRIWQEAVAIEGTAGETYFRRRGITLSDVPNYGGLRWHPRCPWEGGTAPCVIARFTDAITGEPRGMWRRPIDSIATGGRFTWHHLKALDDLDADEGAEHQHAKSNGELARSEGGDADVGKVVVDLRLYQALIVSEFDRLVERGDRSILLVAPTGSGKTIIGAAIINCAIRRGHRGLVIAHRREIITQTRDKLIANGVNPAIVLAGFEDELRPYANVQVAGIQTLHARAIRSNRMPMPAATYLIIDEAHHA